MKKKQGKDDIIYQQASLLAYKRSTKGFTLIEIIVGMAVLSIVMIAFLTLFAASYKINTKVDEKSKAFYLAESYMELVYNESQYGDISTAASNIGFNKQGSIYEKNEDGFKLTLKFTDWDGLYKVLIKTYPVDDTTTSLAQIEDIMPFK